ncbi:MAG: AzlC family ABC transporter permease [Lachnospiraceae bacterium]|nr:AzlC family ABC transporter permease [Lachnospiraceae bacterium]
MLQATKAEEFKDGFKKGIPIGVGYLAVSFTFGIWAVESGVPIWMTILISITNLTSAGQFAGTGLMVAGASFFEIGLSVFVINIRYMLMSLALTQKLAKRTRIGQKLIFGYAVTDEVFAIASTREKEVTAHYMFGLISTPILGWTLGTALGAITGSILPERLADAMGIALYAMFIAIIIPPAKKSRPILGAIAISIVITCVLRYVPIFNFITEGFAMIIATVLAAGIMAKIAPIKEDNKIDEDADINTKEVCHE